VRSHIKCRNSQIYEKFAKLSRQEADWGLLDAARKMSGGDRLCGSTHRRG